MPDQMVTLLYGERTGAFDRIVSLLRRRGFPIRGITVERTHEAGIGRMSISVQDAGAVQQVVRHLDRLPDVFAVEIAAEPLVICREYALARVRCVPAQRSEVMALVAAFEARVAGMTGDELVVEASGSVERLDALFDELRRYGIEESARTNPIALGRASRDAERQTA